MRRELDVAGRGMVDRIPGAQVKTSFQKHTKLAVTLVTMRNDLAESGRLSRFFVLHG